MKRVWIAAALILLVNLVSGWGLYRITTVTDKLDASLDTLSQAIAQKESGQVQDLTAKFFEDWHENQNTLERYIHHEALDSITGLAARLPVLAEYGDYSQLAAETTRIRELLYHVYEAEIPNLNNIF